MKAGSTSPLEFAWFVRTLPGARLKVIGVDRFTARPVTGLTLEDFLLEDA